MPRPVCVCGGGGSPVNVVLSVCREIVVDDQGNLLDIDSTSLETEQNLGYTLRSSEESHVSLVD